MDIKNSDGLFAILMGVSGTMLSRLWLDPVPLYIFSYVLEICLFPTLEDKLIVSTDDREIKSFVIHWTAG